MLGTSSKIFDSSIQRLVELSGAKNILELGCGQGKFGALMMNSSVPRTIRAVQKVFSEKDIDLLKARGYAEVIDVDIYEYFKNGFDEAYDMVVALDVIEHFLYSDVISIINFALYRSDYMLLVWPSAHPQSGTLHSFDRHRSSFELRDLTDKFDVVCYSQSGFAEMNCVHRYHIALLRGHMNAKVLPAY
jgi:hypothetical protein